MRAMAGEVETLRTSRLISAPWAQSGLVEALKPAP
jgi:hypothetical protein